MTDRAGNSLAGELEAIYSGDDDRAAEVAFGYLIEKYGAQVQRYIQARVSVPGDREDVFQDTLVSTLTSRSRFTPDRPFQAWLMGIAKHKVLDYWERRRKALERKELSVEDCHDRLIDGTVPVMEQILDRERDHLRIAWLKTLTVDDRLLITMRATGMVYDDLATHLGVTRHVIIYRLKIKLPESARNFKKCHGIFQ